MKTKQTLYYDESCPFCDAVAHWLGRNYGIDICAGQKCPKIPGIPRAAMVKDVHFVVETEYENRKPKKGIMVYVGSSAAFKVISLKHPFVWGLYNFKLTHWACDLSYLMLKKLRKYLSMVF